MLFQIKATLFSSIEKFYPAKVQKNHKTEKKNNIGWENAKGECFWDPHFKMHEKMHVIWIYLVSFLVSYPRGISPP